MSELVYPREKALGTITLVLGVIIWLGVIIGTVGAALIGLAVGFLLYLFAQSALISYLRGNGVELSQAQFPDLYSQFTGCCDQLEIKEYPQAYVVNGNGGLNAFATKFLGTQYVVLMSDVVDAMEGHPDGVRFYIGHELGHLRMKHLNGHLLRWPVLWLPILGAAYSRARESTCDRHGLACSESPEGAARALAALSAGVERWKKLDLTAYLQQNKQSSGFWMSFHELTAGYPWLAKRVARVIDINEPMPKRNRLAYFFAIFIPYAGPLGAGFGFLILVYILGVLAAVAIPAYQDYTIKAEISMISTETRPHLENIARYYETNQEIPASLEVAGAQSQLADGTLLSLDQEDMSIKVGLEQGDLFFIPSLDDQGQVFWQCSSGEGLKPIYLPDWCRIDE